MGPAYHFVIGFNLIGRVVWSLAISPHFCDSSCKLSIRLLEMIRRGVWMVIRMEFECQSVDAVLLEMFDVESGTGGGSNNSGLGS